MIMDVIVPLHVLTLIPFLIGLTYLILLSKIIILICCINIKNLWRNQNNQLLHVVVFSHRCQLVRLKVLIFMRNWRRAKFRLWKISIVLKVSHWPFRILLLRRKWRIFWCVMDMRILKLDIFKGWIWSSQVFCFISKIKWRLMLFLGNWSSLSEPSISMVKIPFILGFKECYEHIAQINRFLKLHVHDLYLLF